MIKRLVVAALLASPVWAQAQDVEKGSNVAASVKKPSRDFVMLSLGYNGWVKPDSIQTKGLGRTAHLDICYDFPIKKTHLSFAAGIGIGASNIYLNDQILLNTDTFTAARFVPETTNYKRYKLTTTYLEAPFELRYFANKDNRNKGFKAAVGMRVGTLISAHVKGRLDSTKVNYKENSKKYLSPWQFEATLRLGYGNFSIFGAYNITPLFKDGQGPLITPYSIGLTITGL